MADNKPTSNHYDLLGGINQKASEYAVGRAQFLDIRNMDFDVPNALQKRPGSTQAVTTGTSGPVNSIFEFVKLTGESYVVAGSDTAMFYLASNAYTLLDSGWSNGQPTDMLTFVNKLWMANGQNYKSWDGTTLRTIGLPCPKTTPSLLVINAGGATSWKVAGVTANFIGNYPFIYVAYGYVRGDGYYGPVDFYARGNRLQIDGVNNGDNVFSAAFPVPVGGFSAPAGYGISAIALYVGLYTQFPVPTNDVGNFHVLNSTVSIEGKFYLYTLLSAGATVATLVIPSWTDFQSTATPFANLSAMDFCWFDSNTPKYLEVNQNVMFTAGFSQNPSVVWYSDLGQPEKIQSDFNFEVRTNDGDRVMATKAYNNQLLILKENSLHKVVGDNPDNFQLVELTQQFGCLSNKTVVEFNEKLAWLDARGVVLYDGASWRLISGGVEDTFRRMNITNAKEKACAVNYKFRNQLWFGVPLDSSTQNNVTIVYDYLVDAWTIFEGFNPAGFAFMKGALTRPTVWRGDYSGLIHYHGESFFGDNGSGMTCTARPHWDKWQGEQSTNIWRRFFLDVASVSGLTGQITGKVFSNYDNSTVQATYTIYQNQFQSRAEMGVVGKAVTTEWAHYSASLPLLVNGFSWTKRTLRNV